ncbi:MAG: triose-phosphate isomerase [Anaerolineae bacterium]|nr:triose-phosphate isomerase [Anaerolineae bacterium]
MPHRKPVALANWKMAMSIADSRRFVEAFLCRLGDVLAKVDVVLCPPYTALYPVGQALAGSSVQLGAQNLTSAAGKAHTGAISADLLADVGCCWVLVGHWEIRRRTGERDVAVNHKALAALDAGLHPILLIGEGADQRDEAAHALRERLPLLFANMDAQDVMETVVVYEPEWTIGADEPAPPDRVAAGCRAIRQWVAGSYGTTAANKLRTIYGGSVTPDYAEALLASPEVDGLGAGRKGRDPQAFAEIVRIIAQAKKVE